MGLHWLDVELDTPLRDIGWTYVVLLTALLFVTACVRWLWKNW